MADQETAITAGTSGLVTYHDVEKPPSPPPGPGVRTPGVKIPIARLEPEAVFMTGGSPDWLMAVEAEDSVWVSDNPNGRVLRLDAKTNAIAATVIVGKNPSSGLAAGFALAELREGVIDDRWIAVKPKWERFRHHPVSVAYAWRRPTAPRSSPR